MYDPEVGGAKFLPVQRAIERQLDHHSLGVFIFAYAELSFQQYSQPNIIDEVEHCAETVEAREFCYTCGHGIVQEVMSHANGHGY